MLMSWTAVGVGVGGGDNRILHLFHVNIFCRLPLDFSQ